MNRNLGVQRVYSLGDYKSLRLMDEISGLPDEVVFNLELAGKIRELQLLQLEMDYRRYIKLNENLEHYNLEDAYNALVELGETTIQQIAQLFQNGDIKELKEVKTAEIIQEEKGD